MSDLEPEPLLGHFNPARSALLDLLRPLVSDAMLREIAEADYGYRAEGHLAALLPIRDCGEMPNPMGWEPEEVLTLTRWSEPDLPNWEPGTTGMRGHLMRSFACMALLMAGAEPGNDDLLDGANETLAQLLASALVLGPDVQDGTARLLAWVFGSVDDDEVRPFVAYGLLLLAVLMGQDRYPEHILNELADWVMRVEDSAHARIWSDPADRNQWLLGLSYHNQRHCVWQALTRKMLAATANLSTPAVQAKLADIGERVLRAA